MPFERVLAVSRICSQQATVSTVIYTDLVAGGPKGIVRQSNGLRAFLATFLYREQQLETAHTTALAGDSKAPAP